MSEHFAIVTPCFNEERAIIPFLLKLERALMETNRTFSIIVIDDCSQDNTLSLLSTFNFSSSFLTLCLLRLKYNVGHQSAIYQGLLYANEIKADKVIVMDSDGEDDPMAIPMLISNQEYDIVEVKRGKRSESLLFKVLYMFYRIIFHLITGKSMNYGNYCMISKVVVERIVHTSFIHFPAYLLKQKASRTSIKYNRDKRIHGKSKMRLQGLLIHSFKSFIEFAEDFLMIFLKMFTVIMILLFFLFVEVLYQKFVSHTAILGWTSTLMIGLVNIALICLGFFVTGILLLHLMHQQTNRTQSCIYSVIRK